MLPHKILSPLTSRVSPLSRFFDESYCSQRSVTDMSFSPFFDELLLVAYNARSDSTNDWNPSASAGGGGGGGGGSGDHPDGVVLVWSQLLKSRPEYVFTCQSAVLTAFFDPFDRNLIYGGTYSGQIVLWDTRAKVRGSLTTL